MYGSSILFNLFLSLALSLSLSLSLYIYIYWCLRSRRESSVACLDFWIGDLLSRVWGSCEIRVSRYGFQADLEGAQGFAEGSSYFLQRRYSILSLLSSTLFMVALSCLISVVLSLFVLIFFLL